MKNLLREYFSVRGTRKQILLALVVSTITALISARITIWISNIVSNVNNMPVVIQYLKILIVGLVLNTVLRYVSSLVIKRTRDDVYTELSNRLTDQILQADYKTFTKYSSGQIQTVVSSLSYISRGGKLVLDIITSGINFIAITASIMLIDIRLIIPIVVIYGIGVIIYRAIWKRAIALDREADDLADQRNCEGYKIIAGFAEIRTNNTQKYHSDLLHDLNYRCREKFQSKAKVISSAIAVINTMDTFIVLSIVCYSIIAIPNGLASSLAMSIVIYVEQLFSPLFTMIELSDAISEHVTKAERYSEFMAVPVEIHDGDIELESFEHSIKFNNVFFSYDKSDTVLNGISLTIKKGEKVGICGNSGGGKSTLLKLIPRLYDVSEGSISIDNIDIRKLTLESLRNKIGFVHQSNYIFKGTIKDNVKYGCGDVSDYEVVEACKKACIYDFIMSLPDKFNTDVGPNGLKLSGGQQQRIAIARIFLNNPDIILLDEATSALDNESEAIIQGSLKQFSDKTIIAIAHRLSTIQDFDKIVVIDDHEVAEVGTHEQLMKKDGIYHHLYTAKDN